MEHLDVPAVLEAITRLRVQLNDPISEPDVAGFEQKHGILLPPDYREFITRVGNGGDGPFYGVFPLGSMDDNLDMRQWQENDGFVGTLSKPFSFHDEWNDVSGMPEDDLLEQDEDAYNKQIEAFESTYWSSNLMHGAIPICHEGCALRIWLIVSGEQAGHLWEDRRSEYKGLRPVRLIDGSRATFSGWYKEWLDSSFSSSGQANYR
jgi:SMI1/KNR4 family protein SUKH-1